MHILEFNSGSEMWLLRLLFDKRGILMQRNSYWDAAKEFFIKF